MTRTTLIAAAFFLCLGLATGAHAQQRPLVTEDPETIGNGNVLLEGGISLEKDVTNEASGIKADVTRVAIFGVSVGIGPTAELQVDGGLLQRVKVTELLPSGSLAGNTSLVSGATTSGFDDLTVATKIRLLSETPGRPALGARFGTKLPTADADNGIGLGTTDFFASFLIAKTVQSVRTVGNVGLLVLGNPVDGRDPATSLGLGVSVARAVTDEFEVVGEFNGRLDPFGDVVPAGLENRGVLRFAGRYTYQLLRLDFGMLIGITERDPSFGITAGATYVITR